MLSGWAAPAGPKATYLPAPPRDARWAAEWVLPVLAPPIRAGAVAVEAGRIVAVGGRDGRRAHARPPA